MADGFSSIDPKLARGRQESARQATARRSSRGRGSSTPTPNVKISGGTVIINGQGFSVAPTLQAEFIRQRTGSQGSSAQAAINLANMNEKSRRSDAAKKAAIAREQEIQRIANQRKSSQIAQEQAKAEQLRIIAERNRLIRAGAKEQKTRSRDVKTGATLIVTQWRLDDGTRVQKTENLRTKTTEYRSFAPFRKGGRVVMTGGVVKGEGPTPRKPTAADIAAKVKISPSNNTNKIIVTFPNGQTGLINSKGTVIVGKNLAGRKYLFKDGAIIAVDGKTTFAREEFVIPTGEVQPITTFAGKGNIVIGKFTYPTVARLLQNNGVPKESSLFKKIDAKLGGILPGGVSRKHVILTKKEVEMFDKFADRIIKNGKITKKEMKEIRDEIMKVEEKGSFAKGFQKVAVSKGFQSKEVRKDQEKKEKRWNNIINKMKRGEKLNQNDISDYKDIAKFTPEKLIDKDVAKFAQVSGGVIGTFIAPIPGAIIWAMGDTMESVRRSSKDGGKVSKQEFGKIVLDSVTKGAIMGAGMKLIGGAGSIASKRILTGAALRRAESTAVRAALNHGGVVIKLVGRSGKNFIQTYFMKDMLGNVFEITREVKSGNFNNVLRKTIETGGAIGGYIGGSAIGKATTKGALAVSGKLRPTIPEFAQKKTQLDVMSKQLLSEGKIVLTRRGVYETGKGLSPRKDAWLDSKVKNPTNSVFWRFDKTLSKKDQAISPLPLFTKSKTGYLKMFKTNWNKNKGMSAIKRYIKTTAETPIVEDVVIRRIVKLKDIKDIKLRKDVLRQYATTGKLNKATQERMLKNPKFGISDKNREFGFHDENEFVTRAGFKFKGRKDISWTYDPTLQEYVPIIESLKTTNRLKNFLSLLNKKKIITRTDAKFISDNYAIKKQFTSSSILPHKHSYTHMKQVEGNILKLMDKYPQYNSYWKRQYGSIAKAKDALKQAMWHDIGKGESASVSFGTPHGEKVWRVWKAGLLPKDIKLTPKVAKAIKKHETLDPRKLWYKVQNKVKLVSPEEKIVATADRLDLVRVGIKVDIKRLPLPNAVIKLNLKQNEIKYPERFNFIIAKIKIDKGVTKSDLKKLSDFLKSKVVSKAKAVSYKTSTWKSYKSTKKKDAYRVGWSAANRAGSKAPTNYNSEYKGDKEAYIKGYRAAYKGRYRINSKTGEYKRIITRRPTKRITKRPIKRIPARRPPKRPVKRPARRPPKRPTGRPPTRPPTKKKPPVIPKLPSGFKKKTIPKAQPVFFIKVKSKGKIVNLTPRPLILRDAKDYLAYKLDKNLVRTAYFEPIGRSKNVVRIPSNMRGYFTRNSKKLRPYKIRVGKKKLLRNGYIEKRKFALDTKKEKAQLKKAKTTKKKKKK